MLGELVGQAEELVLPVEFERCRGSDRGPPGRHRTGRAASEMSVDGVEARGLLMGARVISCWWEGMTTFVININRLFKLIIRWWWLLLMVIMILMMVVVVDDDNDFDEGDCCWPARCWDNFWGSASPEETPSGSWGSERRDSSSGTRLDPWWTWPVIWRTINWQLTNVTIPVLQV